MLNFGYNIAAYMNRPFGGGCCPCSFPTPMMSMPMAMPMMSQPSIFGGYGYYPTFNPFNPCFNRRMENLFLLNFALNSFNRTISNFANKNEENTQATQQNYYPNPIYAPRIYTPFDMFNIGTYQSPTVSKIKTVDTVDKSNKTDKAKKASKTKKTQDTTNWNINTRTDLPQFADINYNAEKGKELITDALTHAKKKSTKKCAKYVKNTIERCGLGQYVKGDAYECADILSKNTNFKEIQVSGNDLAKLPAGCIIVYNKGAAGYSKKYGHIEITKGDGTATSDFANNAIKASENVRVFVPIKLQA